MKIVRVEAVPLSIPCRHGAEGWTLGTGGWKALDFCLVRVDTDAGITGWGEAFSYSCRRAVAAAVDDMIAPLAVGRDAGRDAGDIEGLHGEIQRRLHIFGRFGITAFALSGLDIALWDIAGKAAGKPLHALLGGAQRQRLPCYASLLRYADESLVARYCERALGEGFGAIKLHEVSEPVIAAARAVVPDAAALQLDVNCEWSVEDAIAVGRRLAPDGARVARGAGVPARGWRRPAGRRRGVPAFPSRPGRTAALRRSLRPCSTRVRCSTRNRRSPRWAA